MTDEFQRQTNTFFIQSEEHLSQLFDGPASNQGNTLLQTDAASNRRSFTIQQKKQIIEDNLQVRDINKLRGSSLMLAHSDSDSNSPNYDIESQCFDSLVKFIFSRNFDQLQIYLNKIDQALILAFPRMLHADGGKSLIHICSRLKTYLIMEEIVEKFREMSIKEAIEDKKLSFKQANRRARS